MSTWTVGFRVPMVGSRFFSFPDPVNEVSARLVAAGVVVLSLATMAFDQPALLVLIAYGFVARVLAGPTLSPLALLVTRVVTPRLPVAPRLVPGPPKRFAQGIGAVLSLSAAVLAFGFDQRAGAYALLAVLIAAATLEAVFAVCLGCHVFALLMRTGLIPERVCSQCSDLWSRPVTRPF
ncbi:MAG: DUF4395 domain-containing protein [Acidimicrobiales bacterium]